MARSRAGRDTYTGRDKTNEGLRGVSINITIYAGIVSSERYLLFYCSIFCKNKLIYSQTTNLKTTISMSSIYRRGLYSSASRFPVRTSNLGEVVCQKPLTVNLGTQNCQLLVSSIDLLKSKMGQNRLEHHTDNYQIDNLIVRRGQSFQMWIELSRNFNPRSDHLHLVLKLDDTVFMDNEDERNEYVLNDVGKMYSGTAHQIEERTWNFGQFAEGVLVACLYILEKSKAPASGWEDPITISRVVSAMVNSDDDQGVLVGNWSENYVGGTPPTAWSSSVDILKQYHKSKGLPVKYGQCWVFSGVELPSSHYKIFKVVG